MLFSLKQARNWNVEADDGDIGSCRDFLLSSRDWTIRYVMTDSRNRPRHRRLLIATIWLRKASISGQRLEVEGTKNLIEARAKDIVFSNRLKMLSRSRPGSYGSTHLLWGGLNNPAFLPNRARDFNSHSADPDTPNLEPAERLLGYTITDSDGFVGSLEDIVMDDRDWTIHHIVVGSLNCALAKRFLIATRCFADVQWEARRIRLDLSRQQVESSLEVVPLTTYPGA